MNIVYGYGGMRSDGDMLAFAPSIPETWTSFSFRIIYQEALLTITVNKKKSNFKTDGKSIRIRIYGSIYTVDGNGLDAILPKHYFAQ